MAAHSAIMDNRDWIMDIHNCREYQWSNYGYP